VPISKAEFSSQVSSGMPSPPSPAGPRPCRETAAWADTVPDANTIWGFREALTRARLTGKPAMEVLFACFGALSPAGFLAMSGQIIDASIVAAPKQRNTDGEKRDIKEGRIPLEWAAVPDLRPTP
jgi:hypothetical protein